MGLQTANWGVGVRWDVQARNSKGCPLILIGNVSNGPEIELATSSENALHSPYVFYECGENCGEATIKAPKGLYLLDNLAEAVRFELTEGSHPRRFSRPVHSTALPSFRVEIQAVL
ncbi:MAG: hypothetical protein RI902_677 [Pseudomonadota bacterium]